MFRQLDAMPIINLPLFFLMSSWSSERVLVCTYLTTSCDIDFLNPEVDIRCSKHQKKPSPNTSTYLPSLLPGTLSYVSTVPGTYQYCTGVQYCTVPTVSTVVLILEQVHLEIHQYYPSLVQQSQLPGILDPSLGSHLTLMICDRIPKSFLNIPKLLCLGLCESSKLHNT